MMIGRQRRRRDVYSEYVRTKANLTIGASERMFKSARKGAVEATVHIHDNAIESSRTVIDQRNTVLQNIQMIRPARSAGNEFERRRPLCFKLVSDFYHHYGMKHVILILVLLFYAFFGAFVFMIVEAPAQRQMKNAWTNNIITNRSRFVSTIITELYNNSQFLVYIKGGTTHRINTHLNRRIGDYERSLNLRWSEQKMEWDDYWNAVLYAGTIITTIGYGHIYPMTPTGQVLTMIYALMGIPLVLLVLQDLGKLLTLTMKYPWFQFKRLFRRLLRYCTQQALSEIHRIEMSERDQLDVFDVPLTVGLALIVGWVSLCTCIFSYWDTKWTPLEAFYFFFISLSTIGLGDPFPTNPRLLLAMFAFILIGLSLVSMVINLFQVKMRHTYEGGGGGGTDQPITSISECNDSTTLGILQCFNDDAQHHRGQRSQHHHQTRSTQTSLSLPILRQLVLTSDGVHWINDLSSASQNGFGKSPDEVTTLVESNTEVRVMSDLGEQLMLDDDDDYFNGRNNDDVHREDDNESPMSINHHHVNNKQ